MGGGGELEGKGGSTLVFEIAHTRIFRSFHNWFELAYKSAESELVWLSFSFGPNKLYLGYGVILSDRINLFGERILVKSSKAYMSAYVKNV